MQASLWPWALSAVQRLSLPTFAELSRFTGSFLTSGHPLSQDTWKDIRFTPVSRGSWLVAVAPATQCLPTSSVRTSKAKVDSRVFLAESSIKREEISSSTPTSFLAMQV